MLQRVLRFRRMAALSALTIFLGCEDPRASDASTHATASTQCPERAPAPKLLPGTRPEHARLDYWLARYSTADLDAPLLSVDEIRAYNSGVGRAGDEAYSQRDLLLPLDAARLQHDVNERLRYLRERLRDGRYVDRAGKSLAAAALSAFDTALPSLTPELRVALEAVPLRCGPFAQGLFERKAGAAPNLVYDRNACSTARPQEVVQVLAAWPNGMSLARTRYALGFIDSSALLSPPIPKALEEAFVHGPRARVSQDTEIAGTGAQRHLLPKHASAPLTDASKVSLASTSGFQTLPAKEALPTRRNLTRRALFATAFQFLDSPYAFGDAGGGRDCSRMTMDLFEAFDIALPRHSGSQAKAGTFQIDFDGMGEPEKLGAIEQAAQHGAVLLHLAGHVMLYLGKNADGVPMAIHALGEYARPCAGGKGEMVLDVQRTVVSDLRVGEGSARGSFLRRLTGLAVFGGAPSPALSARAHVHTLPPLTMPTLEGACQDSAEARIFFSPARPLAATPLRVIATTTKPLAESALWLFDPHGALVARPVRRLGGPPFSAWARIETPEEGRYTALFVDGNKRLGCKRIAVRAGTLAAEVVPEGPVWTPRWSWEQDTLNLWSAFVEQLFAAPPDDERTWTDLHTLLRDPARNLLHNHLGQGEDASLTLVPDCADLPFALRAYFSWKLRLPFAYRRCSRGRPKVPPSCGPPASSLMAREAVDELEAFSIFVNRRVASGVQSATGRTHPEDSETDLYPVALTRESLPPGTVYADPYGHVMIITQWFAQGRDPNAYGILMAAEAQPDNTLGRRRFSQGSFLFDPSTTDAGAGFKQFRPLTYDRVSATLLAPDNATLAKSDLFARYSTEQYEISKDDFYDRLDRLINPAALDPQARLMSLLDAFEETVKRRVLAVDNGEQFMAQHPQVVPMPSGHDIFETTGPWEDYATPSRDMRLLISLDALLALPAQVEKAPERYRLADAAQAKQAGATLREHLDHELRQRSFAYTKSNGQAQQLSLYDVVQRSAAMEAAYNPNDCVERRWGAGEGSAEMQTCKRHAPAAQQSNMQRYRAWFRTRTRPARGTKG